MIRVMSDRKKRRITVSEHKMSLQTLERACSLVYGQSLENISVSAISFMVTLHFNCKYGSSGIHFVFTNFSFFSSQRVIVQRILPCLTSEFVNPDMVPFVLPNVLLIAEECTKEEYIKLILPELGPVFKQQEPIQVCCEDFQMFMRYCNSYYS